MGPTNADVADVLERVATLLEVDQASPFRIRAYRNAADTIRALDVPVAEMVARDDDLTELQDVGKGIAKTVEEIVAVGRDAFLAKLDGDAGPGILELLRIPGIGPGRVRRIREVLGVTSIEGLREAAEARRLRDVPGFGAKTEESILRRIRRFREREAERSGD